MINNSSIRQEQYTFKSPKFESSGEVVNLLNLKKLMERCFVSPTIIDPCVGFVLGVVVDDDVSLV